MSSEHTESVKPDIPKIIGIVGSSAPKLFFRFAPLFILFKKQAKKGGQIFLQTLLDHGVEKETADRLTEIYLQGSDLLSLFRIFQ